MRHLRGLLYSNPRLPAEARLRAAIAAFEQKHGYKPDQAHINDIEAQVCPASVEGVPVIGSRLVVMGVHVWVGGPEPVEGVLHV